MHIWKKNDAAKIVNGNSVKIYRVLSVTRNNLPTVRVGNDQVIAKTYDEWEYVGTYKWTLNPLTPGDPFYYFVPLD